MKKFITLALALILTLSMAVCAFAATLEAAGSETAIITGSYTPSSAADPDINVVISWDVDFTFTYGGGKETWNPESHRPDPATPTWSTTPFVVKVTNNSNVDIDVEYTVESTVNTVSFNVDGDTEVRLGGWQNGTPTVSESEIEVTVVETSTLNVDFNGQIGTVKVEITQA